MSARTRSGRRVLGLMYVVTVSVIGVFGYLVGIAVQPQLPVAHVGIGPLALPLTPVNVAVVGMVMVGIVLTVLFGGVVLVSKHVE